MPQESQARDLSLACKRIILTIEQLEESHSESHDQPSRQWEVQITVSVSRQDHPHVNWRPIRNVIFISDPLTKDEREQLAQYLNKILKSPRWTKEETKKYEEVSNVISRSGDSLLASLKLGDFTPEGMLDHSDLEVEICTKSDLLRRTSEKSRSIQCLLWELLEQPQVWKQILKLTYAPKTIRVRRDIKISDREHSKHGSPKGDRPHEHMIPKTIGTFREIEEFRMLVVVARRFSMKSPDIWSPTEVQTAVVKMCEKLAFDDRIQRVKLHVVRPGTYTELLAALNSNLKYGIVHFDMHGGVSVDDTGSRAFLQFNNTRGNTNELADHYLTGQEITQLADLLVSKGIKCVVLGACRSADADAHAHANLSWIFVERGIQNVLAMSYNAPDTMSELFFDRFYHELFLGRKEFSESARIAREYLMKNPKRYHYQSTEWRMLNDWFVPIVYSNGTHFTIRSNPSPFRLRLRLKGLYLLMHWLWLFFYYGTLWVLIITDTFFAQTLGGRFQACCAYTAYLLLSLPLIWLWKWWLHVRKLKFEKRLEHLNRDKRNILRLEHDLRRKSMVFFYSKKGDEAQGLLRLLVILWEKTGLVYRTFWLDAAHFKAKSHWRVNAASVQIRAWEQHGRATHQENDPRMLVVIENINGLYPEGQDLKPIDQENQKRLQSWLEETFSRDHRSYLIVAGRGAGKCFDVKKYTERTKKWFDETIGRSASLRRNMILTGFVETAASSLIKEEPGHFPASQRGEYAG